MKRDVADDAVVLVEDGEDCDALRHRRDAGLVGSSRGSSLASRHLILLGAAVASGKRERSNERDGDPVHAYSGIHGS